MRFPTLMGTSLLGDDVALPAGLPAERTLVLCAFKQRQQAQVDRWIDRAVADLGVAASPLGIDADVTTAVIEVPCLGRKWRPVRRLIDGGMASSIAQPPILARTITVYADVGAILAALDAPSAAEVQARVVRRSGEILASAAGEPAGAGWDAIAAALR
ncbi:MAG: hypothetical protein ACR2J9_11280 [Gaiellales bacterium]